jgi:hypothetical protein
MTHTTIQEHHRRIPELMTHRTKHDPIAVNVGQRVDGPGQLVAWL